MYRKRLRGVTLVEVMVLLGITGVVVLLIIPAVQSARAQARRASCIANLQAMGLALHNYASANETLPMSHVRGEGRGIGQSVFVSILPYLEEAPVYNGYNFWLEVWDDSNVTAVQTRLSEFVCPDNHAVENVPASELKLDGVVSPATFGKGHYAANWGGGRDRWGKDFAARQGTYLGVMMTVIAPDGEVKAPDGQARARVVRLRDIADGMATTIALGEKQDSLGWAVGGFSGSEFDVNTKPANDEDDLVARRVYSGSIHKEGIHAGFCDGSVRRLDPGMHRMLWYALITRAGGEAIQPDPPGLSAILNATRDVTREARERPLLAARAAGELAALLKAKPPGASTVPIRSWIQILDLQTGTMTPIAAEPKPGFDESREPAWSQDGRRILFAAQPHEHPEWSRIFAIDMKDGRAEIADLGPGFSPALSPTGDRVLFLLGPSAVPGQESGVWMMRADGTDRRRLGGYGRPRWSPDGHRFLIATLESPVEVTLIDDRPGHASGMLQVHKQEFHSMPSWAEDETIVAVLGNAETKTPDAIALVNVAQPDRANVKTILWTRGNGLDVEPRDPIFCPATGRCVFVGFDKQKGTALYAVDAGKPSAPKRLDKESENSLVLELAYSPDGRHVLFSGARRDH